MRYRLLALDVDGTLLDPYGALTPGAREAVAAARRAGLQVVLCTGRRYRTALPVLRALDLEGSVVVHNGAVVKDATSGRTLHGCYLSRELCSEVLELLREGGPPMVYLDGWPGEEDILTEREREAHPFQTEYLRDHATHCGFVSDLGASIPDHVIMVSRMGDVGSLRELRERVSRRLGARVGTHLIHNKNYQGVILEFFAPGAGKWPALARVAAEAGVAPEQIAAVGDDANDAELLRRAGLGIAMGNAGEQVRRAADLVVRSNAEGGVIEAIEHLLAG
jgi:Cof subfamily protein (haloacid dehalogenase superfamily)